MWLSLKQFHFCIIFLCQLEKLVTLIANYCLTCMWSIHIITSRCVNKLQFNSGLSPKSHAEMCFLAIHIKVMLVHVFWCLTLWKVIIPVSTTLQKWNLFSDNWEFHLSNGHVERKKRLLPCKRIVIRLFILQCDTNLTPSQGKGFFLTNPG